MSVEEQQDCELCASIAKSVERSNTDFIVPQHVKNGAVSSIRASTLWAVLQQLLHNHSHGNWHNHGQDMPVVMAADLTKLPLLEAVLKEALRLHSTAPMGSVRSVFMACPTAVVMTAVAAPSQMHGPCTFRLVNEHSHVAAFTLSVSV